MYHILHTTRIGKNEMVASADMLAWLAFKAESVLVAGRLEPGGARDSAAILLASLTPIPVMLSIGTKVMSEH